MECATHPGIETVLTCSKCDKPICPRCLVQTPVGARCRGCAGLRRIPTYELTAPYFLRGALAGLGTALATGGLAGLVLRLLWPIPFMVWIVPIGLILLGSLLGEAISLATNRKRGPLLVVTAVVCLLVSYFLLELLTPGLLLRDPFVLLGLLIALFTAASPLR
ncbi:MAG: hypothetical protein HYU29_05480 [Chloroflexi bacterium]|nr:hypothetical protein [Chloroflexota bacterium]